MNRCQRRLCLLFALGLGFSPLWTSYAQEKKDAPAIKNDYFIGKVIPLGEVLAKKGIKLDDDAPLWLALATEDGKTYPLVRDAGVRMFYQDKRLLNRPMRLTGRVVPGTGLVQVVYVHSYVKGVLHDVYYWCDICTIRGYQFVICDCCGGPMELREVPLAPK